MANVLTALLAMAAVSAADPFSYCSHPDELAARAIRPVADDSLELVQVQAIIRHGARAPTASLDSCWADEAAPDAIPPRFACPAPQPSSTYLWPLVSYCLH